jgi:hypothetical protein
MKIKLTKYIFAVLAITFALTSCSKNEDALATVASNKQDILTFKTVDEFNTTVQKVNSMKPEERIAWENSKGFKSFGTICDEVYKGIDPTKFKSLQQVKDTVSKLSAYLEIGQNEEGKYYVDPKSCYYPACKIMNADRMYIIKDSVYKQFDSGCISTEISNIQYLKSLKDIDFQTKSIINNRLLKVISSNGSEWNKEWWGYNTVSGQKYALKVRLSTQFSNRYIPSIPLRLVSYNFNNYKWTLWIYWGDYLSNTHTDITGITTDNTLEGDKNFLFNYDYYAVWDSKTTYDQFPYNYSLNSYFKSYNVYVENGRVCVVDQEYTLQ